MHRFMVEPGRVKDGLITIEGEDVKHLRQVLRLKPGDLVGAFDGTGMEYECELLSVEPAAAHARILASTKSEAEPKIRIALFQGLLKGDKMDFVVQKAVELGAFEIIPFASDHCVVRLEGNDGERKGERWSKIAREAAKQCKRAYAPKVKPPVGFAEALALGRQYEKAVLLYENQEKKCLKEVLKCYTINKIGDIALFIGPEGGFSSQEIEKCRSSGMDIAGLGKRILRAETAAISALSILMYEMGELQ